MTQDLSRYRGRLADLAGVPRDGEGERAMYKMDVDPISPGATCWSSTWWAPESDVAQAIRCAEALHAHGFVVLMDQTYGQLGWDVEVLPVNAKQGFQSHDTSLPAAIVKAIAATLNFDGDK